MYQVNKYFIKPRTAAAGGMSYALMLHPEGLECDVFITHAWAEGVFEFVDKVLAAWPAGADTLWCCFLANPQNGDISKLLAGEVTQSPFAKAVTVSKGRWRVARGSRGLLGTIGAAEPPGWLRQLPAPFQALPPFTPRVLGSGSALV